MSVLWVDMTVFDSTYMIVTQETQRLVSEPGVLGPPCSQRLLSISIPSLRRLKAAGGRVLT
jgi:hypothetical protein